MAIELKEIEKLAALARIEVSPEEKESLRNEINAILEYVKQIQAVSPTEGEKETGALKNVLREDVDTHLSGAFSEELLREVPQREGNYVRVKKIL